MLNSENTDSFDSGCDCRDIMKNNLNVRMESSDASDETSDNYEDINNDFENEDDEENLLPNEDEGVNTKSWFRTIFG